jgi:hypothetical protein
MNCVFQSIRYRDATIRYPVGVRINSEKRLLASSCLFAHVSACIGSAPTEQIFVKFDIDDFYENQSRISRFGYNRTPYNEKVAYFFIIQSLLQQNAHVLYY